MWRAGLKVFFIGIMGLLSAMPGLAATQTVTAHIAFASPGSATKSSDVNFGAIKADAVGAHTITPDGVVTSGGQSIPVGETPTASNIMIMGGTDQAINISVAQYTGGGVSPQNATCTYGDHPGGPCEIIDASPPGKGTPLRLGVQAILNGAQFVGAPSPSFTVTITYP